MDHFKIKGQRSRLQGQQICSVVCYIIGDSSSLSFAVQDAISHRSVYQLTPCSMQHYKYQRASVEEVNYEDHKGGVMYMQQYSDNSRILATFLNNKGSRAVSRRRQRSFFFIRIVVSCWLRCKHHPQSRCDC